MYLLGAQKTETVASAGAKADCMVLTESVMEALYLKSILSYGVFSKEDPVKSSMIIKAYNSLLIKQQFNQQPVSSTSDITLFEKQFREIRSYLTF